MKNAFWKELREKKILFLMLVPSVVLALLLCYFPLSGLLIAFKNFKFDKGIWGSEWVGFSNFEYFFIGGTAAYITKNTIVYNLINIFSQQGLAIVIAILITEMRAPKIFSRAVSSCVFLPYFISWPVVGMFGASIFNASNGLLNTMLKGLGMSPVNVYTSTSAWYYIIPIVNAWKWSGYLSIIYVAAIMAIDRECYEAADIDGAGAFQRIWHVTLPGIRPTIVIMLMMLLGKIMRGDFQMFYQLIGNNGQLFKATDVIDTFIFRSLTSTTDFGLTSAVSFYQSFICLLSMYLVNWIVKRIEPEYALF